MVCTIITKIDGTQHINIGLLNIQRKGIRGQSSEERPGLSPLPLLMRTHLEIPTHPGVGGDTQGDDITLNG